MKTYLFYDLETSGLNKCFDQVLQFAAIRTDLELNEIERHEILIKLNCDVVPAPGAVITHLITPESTMSGISEVNAMEHIHNLLNEPGTISLGYNTLAFDDEFLRFSFYKNLLTPYTHQFANQCSRMDIYPMMIFYHLFKPSIIKWPEKNGRPSLKLEKINEINEFFEGQAHDAMVDVEVTLRLARALKQETSMWNYLLGYFDKKTDHERFLKLPFAFGQYRMGLYLEGKVGSRYNYQAPVLDLGEHRHYKNQRCLLRLDLAALREATSDNIDEKTWSLKKKFGEPGFILPMDDRFLKHMNKERLDEMQANLKFLEDNPKTLHNIIEYHLEYKYQNYPETDIDASLYLNGFLTNSDVAACDEFHQAKNKPAMIDEFQNDDLQELALRVCGRCCYDELNETQQTEFNAYKNMALHGRTIDFRGEPKLTVEVALEEINKLSKSEKTTESQKALLANLENFLRAQTAR